MCMRACVGACVLACMSMCAMYGSVFELSIIFDHAIISINPISALSKARFCLNVYVFGNPENDLK